MAALGFDHTYLHPALDQLGQDLRLIYYDQRGHGRSERVPVDRLTFELPADDAAALISALGYDRVGILGHSMGGIIALYLALRSPGLVRSLMPACTTPAWDYGEEIMRLAREQGATDAMLALLDLEQCTTDDQLRAGMQQLAPLYYYRYDAAIAARVFGECLFRGAATAQCGKLLKAYSLLSQLQAITAPTLVLAGRHDFMMPPRLQAGIRKASLHIFEQSGHFPFVEEPAAFGQVIRNWWTQSPM